MARIFGIGLLVVVGVCTLYAFVFLGQQDQLKLKTRFSDRGPIIQCLVYAFARLCSYPHIADLQHAISRSLNAVEAFLLVALGETIGAIIQGSLFECGFDTAVCSAMFDFLSDRLFKLCARITSVVKRSYDGGGAER